MFERIKDHPVGSAAWAAAVFVGTIGGVWYFFTSQAPGPVLLAMTERLLSLQVIGLVLVAVGLLLPLGVFAVITASAVQNKREVERLVGELERSRQGWNALEKRFTAGDFTICVQRLDDEAVDLTGKVLWDYQPNSHYRACSPLDLVREHQAIVAAQEGLIAERDEAVADAKNVRLYFGRERLHFMSRFIIGGKTPTVTIRWVGHGRDYELVRNIEAIFTEFTQWVVTLDGSNVPALRPDLTAKHKVVFLMDLAEQVAPIVEAFVRGRLLDVPVSHRATMGDDSANIVIEVLPDIA